MYGCLSIEKTFTMVYHMSYLTFENMTDLPTGSSSTGCNISGPCARNKCRRASSDRLTLPRSAHATCNYFPFGEKLPIIHLQMPATHLLSPNDNRVSSQANDEFYSGVYDI